MSESGKRSTTLEIGFIESLALVELDITAGFGFTALLGVFTVIVRITFICVTDSSKLSSDDSTSSFEKSSDLK